jgi:hypothetical protein
LVGVEVLEIEASETESVLDMVNDGALDRAGVSSLVGVHETPEVLTGAF